MGDIFSTNEELSLAITHTINNEINKVLDDMINVVTTWKNGTNDISCDTVIAMLNSRKRT